MRIGNACQPCVVKLSSRKRDPLFQNQSFLAQSPRRCEGKIPLEIHSHWPKRNWVVHSTGDCSLARPRHAHVLPPLGTGQSKLRHKATVFQQKLIPLRRNLPPIPTITGLWRDVLASRSKGQVGDYPNMTWVNTYRLSELSTPFLPKFVESRLLQVVWGHDDPEFDIGLKCEEPRLCQRRYLRWVRQIDDEHGAAMSVVLGEIDCLGLGGLENPIQLRARRAILHRGVELLMWDSDVYQYFHSCSCVFEDTKRVPSNASRSLSPWANSFASVIAETRLAFPAP